MTTLIAAGDSFTWGNDLPDCDQQTPSKLSWAAITAQQLGCDYMCIAEPGCSNKTIERKVISTTESLSDILVVVMWTYPHRLEVKLNQDIKSEHYFTVSEWHSIPFEEKIKKWGRMPEGELVFFQRQHDEFEKVGIGDISRVITKYLHNDYYYLEMLRSQILLKYYLESKKIPYLFLPACDNVVFDRMKTNDSYIQTQKKISQTANWLTNPDRGFVEWALINDYKTGTTNHPMQAACKDYAEKYVVPAIRPIVNGES